MANSVVTGTVNQYFVRFTPLAWIAETDTLGENYCTVYDRKTDVVYTFFDDSVWWLTTEQLEAEIDG